ncbi:hypothetical protein OHA79_08320 [Streptomyces sp. NBC_00841]|uniref:hypothetical protein n=1 Tax=Streptomyces sp. NBC_01669 TaxID=2975909 RepID=UPI00225519A3|nr:MULTISPECIES: hypothetical protein [unclassified Streptomyces]MCX4536894.1 hypothetical protein [Streptomyces sp. NBC_01669]WSA04274.1 hypothetical protein OHA79_08320 [Streptomyces sp. NBC_00841]
MLRDPRVARVTGDATAAIFRRSGDIDAEQHPERYRDRPIEEAYCWSNLTSGNGSRALWLLLLPFMVVNLAHWMRPTAKGRTRAVRLYGVLVRLVALSLTVLLTAAACEVALDLVAWQCAGVPECSNQRSWLGFLSTAQDGWWSQPGRRLALAALVPTVLVGLLWFLSNRTWSAYESQRPLNGAEPDDDVLDNGTEATPATEGPGAEAPAAETPVVRPALGRPGFWYGRRLVARLRAAHTAAGFLTVAASVAGAAARHDRAVTGSVPEFLGQLIEAMLVLGTLVVLWVVCRRGRSERRLDNRLDGAVISWLPGTALALLVVTAVYAAWSRPGWVSAGTLPGDVTFGVLTVGQGMLVVALAAVALGLYRRTPEPRTVMYGLGGPAVAMLACALGGVMTGGVAQRVADWLDGPGTPGMGRSSLIDGPPVLLSWQASVIPVLLALLLIPAVVLGVRTWLAARAMEPEVNQEYGEKRPDAARTWQIARTRALAGLTDSAPWLLGLVSGATLLLGAGAVAGAWVSGEVPGLALDGAGPFIESVAEAAQSTGSWMVGFGFIVFVTCGRRAYRDASTRRTIGILWDVGTFWPRAAHPFAPPCYAERAVPDLASRMSGWTGRTRGRLVISGHSQGSVLAASAVWQLPAGARKRVALLTYGSPIERLYGRWFPAYFGPGPLHGLHRSVHCWRNLWRATDPIGGQVRLDVDAGPEVDRGPLRDPLVYGRTPEHPLPEPVLGHSDYQADPVFAEERAALLVRLGPVLPRQADGGSGETQSLSGDL